MHKVSKDPSYILCKKNCLGYITKGKYYRIVEGQFDGNIKILDNFGQEHIFLKDFFQTTDTHESLLTKLFNTIEDED